jgi:hypothetical protein
MRMLFKTLLMGAIFSMAAGPALAADPVIGTWQLNVAKSKFSPGPGPKSQTRTYADSPDGTALTIKSVSADGKESNMTLTFKTDGKPSKANGNPDFDTVKVTRVDERTVKSLQTRGGADAGSGVRSVSKDGKTLTFKQKGTHADGTAYDDVLVYDRE